MVVIFNFYKYVKLYLGSGHFAINGILLMEAILPSPLMCVCIAITAIILAVMLWHMDGAPALKCNDYGLESLLAGHLDKGGVQ